LSFSDQSISFEGDGQQEKLYADSPIIQKITAAENNFSQVNISISKFSGNFGDKIVMEVADESCEKIIHTSKIDAFSWSSPNYEKFRFENIPDSKEKTYCLKFTYIPNGEEQDKKAYISSYSYEGSSYINTGNKKNSGEQENRSLGLKPAYGNGSVWQNFSQLVDRMSQYKPDYFKSLSLEIIFFLSFALILFISTVIIFIK
jgi:hypothetical protein